MAKIGRNEPCPCGSGRKYKRCCADSERTLAVLEEIADLPRLFPRLRPVGSDFDGWADAVAAHWFEEAQIEDGIALLSRGERERIEKRCEQELPVVWRYLYAEAGDVELARGALVSGAVVAAIVERGPLDFEAVEVLEYATDRDRSDYANTLATALVAGDLWSVDESRQADEAAQTLPAALDDDALKPMFEALMAAQAARLAGDWHGDRLAVLVRRLRSKLPLDDAPVASVQLEAACDAFERKPEIRTRLAAYLLGDSLTWERVELGVAA